MNLIFKRLKMRRFLSYASVLVWIVACSCSHTEIEQEQTVKSIMDKEVTELYATKNEEELAAIDEEEAMALFTPEELDVLASKHWVFDVNVPVVVSVMNNSEQKYEPFWLQKTGFEKTGMTMQNEMTTFDVWQKKFDSGTIGLGINGLDNDRYHYFVSVAPQKEGDKLELSNFFPENQEVTTLENGATTYNDWTELVVENVPESMSGQKLLSTVRGRGTESHLVGAFRKTAYPSSANPDQVMQTWSDDPATTIDIQWRTDTTVESGKVVYRQVGSNAENATVAERYRMEDRVLMNDRFTNRFTAHLSNLEPGVTYQYLITPETDWSQANTFSTADNSDAFSFVWFGDTHHSPIFGEVHQQAEKEHPDAAFYCIAGDLVSDGLHREEWDDLFEFSKDVLIKKPLMAVPGNHDNRFGLGAKMYQDMFSFPKDGPEGTPTEQSYAFTYNNALFLMLDATSPIETQTPWIEKQLANSTAKWKFAMFHFSPYNWEEPYPDIQEAWVPIFDKYHVDMVFGGHVHYYMRSKPMKAGQVVKSYNDGTAYIISLAILGQTKSDEAKEEPYAKVREFNCGLYQYLKIDGGKLAYQSISREGKVMDSFTIDKAKM